MNHEDGLVMFVDGSSGPMAAAAASKNKNHNHHNIFKRIICLVVSFIRSSFNMF